MLFSIILASRERVPLLVKFLDSLVDTTQNIEEIEVLIGIDHDDQASCDSEAEISHRYPFVRFYRRERSKFLNQDYLNWMYKFSSGKFIIACNDDVEVRTKNWDKIATETLNSYLFNKPDGIVYGFIEDGLNDRHGMDYCCFPLFSRRAVETLGWLLPGCFMSWNADIAAWRVYKSVDRVCRIPIMFNHVSYHTGQRERDSISHQMEKSSQESGINGSQYDISADVDKLLLAITKQYGPIVKGKYGIVYSFLVPTRERPELLESFVESIAQNTINKDSVEVCIAYDADDKKTSGCIGKLNRKYGSLVRFYGKQRSGMLNRDYVNWLYKFSNGIFLIPCHDDCMVLTHGWDEIVMNKIKTFLADKPDGIFCGTSNGFPVVSRKSADQLGYVLSSDFASWGATSHLERLYSGVNRITDLSEEIALEHISYHNNKREKDAVNMFVERNASRATKDVYSMDISEDLSKLNDLIKSSENFAEIIKPKKPNLLFVTEKWCDGNPQAGITNSHHNLFGSLELSEVASHKCLHFDEYYLKYGRSVDDYLLELCVKERPDAIISSYLCHPAHLNVKPETWDKIKNMKIPIIFMWFDSVLPFVSNIADSLATYAAVSVSLDTNKDNFLSMWTPQDIRYYFNPHTDRDIDVCFLGSVQGYQDRIIGIEALKYNNIEVFHSGGQRENPLPLESYANVMQRSKICLSFPKYRGANYVQAKGRIFEATLCGAMLMDADNDQTKKWFNPGEHYISFTSEEDLVMKVKYYLNNEAERNAIAQAGWLKTSTSYTSRNFWRTVLRKAGVC